MNSDEINRTIEFILQSQAKAAVRMDETDRHLRDLTETTNGQIREVSDHIRELADSTSHQIRELTTSTNRFQDDVKAFIKILAPILEIQSKRLDRLEGHPNSSPVPIEWSHAFKQNVLGAFPQGSTWPVSLPMRTLHPS